MSTTPFTSSDGFATSGNITVESGSYFIGDGSQLTGIAPTVQVYEFANVVTTGGYYQSTWLGAYVPGPEANVTVSISSTPTLLISFITQEGFPGITTIPVGTILVALKTTKASGNKPYSLYAEIWKRNVAGTETLINTSGATAPVALNTSINQVMTDFVATPLPLDVTDRILIKIYAYTTTGTDSITASFDNNSNSGLQIPALPASVNNFVPYTGATANVNLGARTLTTTGNISGANVIATYLYGNGSNITGIPGVSTGNITFSQSIISSNQSDAYLNLNSFGQGVLSLGTNNADNVIIITNGDNAAKEWTFDVAGNLTSPGSITASGNVTGANLSTGGSLSVTGNASVSGTGSNLVRRAYTIAGANTAVTLDNLEARVGGSPTRLYINTVSGNLTGAGDSQTMTSGSMAVSSWINVPIGQGAANAFAMSGTLSSNGDTAILSLIDQGSGTGMWRITGMIANTTANLYGVTIERLV